MSDLDAFVKDEQAVAEFLTETRRRQQAHYDGEGRPATLKLLALLADRERQLAEARQAYGRLFNKEAALTGELEDAEVKLSAVAALRDGMDHDVLGDDHDPDCDRCRLDAILGGDK